MNDKTQIVTEDYLRDNYARYCSTCVMESEQMPYDEWRKWFIDMFGVKVKGET